MTVAVDSVDAQASAWLALADALDTQASWEEAAAFFRSSVTTERWGEQLRAARGPLGPLTTRQLAVEQRLDGLPGAPPGKYAVRQYQSIYNDVMAVVETLTLHREDDGMWRVVGYFIR
jgi:Protein of unknown function (DUF4019)